MAARSGPCPVCAKPFVKGRDRIFNWSGSGDERELFKKVWVHPACARLLDEGHRPRAVRRFGPTPLQLMDVVKRCESELGWTPWPLDSMPALSKDRLVARRQWAARLEAQTEPAADRWDAKPQPKAALLLSVTNLRLAIGYRARNKMVLRDPLQLIEDLRYLHGRQRLHHLAAPDSSPDSAIGNPF